MTVRTRRVTVPQEQWTQVGNATTNFSLISEMTGTGRFIIQPAGDPAPTSSADEYVDFSDGISFSGAQVDIYVYLEDFSSELGFVTDE